MDTDKKAEEVDAIGANWRQFGHKECNDHRMKDLHAEGDGLGHKRTQRAQRQWVAG